MTNIIVIIANINVMIGRSCHLRAGVHAGASETLAQGQHGAPRGAPADAQPMT